MPDFYPPLLNPQLVRLCQVIAPSVCYWRYRMTLKVHPDSIARLKALQHYPLLLLPNHPTYHDWIAIFLLSGKADMAFHYLAAYERFKERGARFLQHLGAYSIRRGLGDRPSVAKTMELLTQPDCHLVVFPEGGCSFQNDTVMPFRPGAIQIPLQTLHKLQRRNDVVPNIHVVPISIKYRYTSDMTPIIHETLSRLERALNFSVIKHPDLPSTFYQRLRRVAGNVLAGLERGYDLHNDGIDQLSWNDRIPRVKARAIADCEEQLGITAPPDALLRERVYRMQYVLEAQAGTLGAEDFGKYDNLHRVAASLLNFDAIYDGYVAEAPTPERFLDTLIRLERQVFDMNYPPSKGHRDVWIHVGDGISLKDHLQDYRRDRAGTVDMLTSHLQTTVQKNLNQLIRRIYSNGFDTHND